MFLGPINVRASRKDVQLKVKEEYNSYRVLLLISHPDYSFHSQPHHVFFVILEARLHDIFSSFRLMTHANKFIFFFFSSKSDRYVRAEADFTFYKDKASSTSA
jgi:hypothetical protein